MKLLIYVLLCLLLVIFAGILLSRESDYVVLTFSDYAVQTRFNFFVIATLVCFTVFYFLIWFIAELIKLPDSYRKWKKHQYHRKSEFYLSKGFLALAEGDWQAAEKLLVKGAAYSTLPVVNYIGAARATQQQGKVQRRDHYLKLAHINGSKAGCAVDITQAELQMNQNQIEQTYATLKQLDSDWPGNDQSKIMMLDASTELKDWSQSLQLLQDLEQRGSLPMEKIRAKQLQAYAGIISRAGNTGNISELNKVWKSVPPKLRKELYIIKAYVLERLKFPDASDCESLLRKIIRKNQDPALVRLYGLVEGNKLERQLDFAEKLLVGNQHDSVLLLTAGRLCTRLGLWGKAKSYMEESIKVEPSPETYYELGTLLRGQDEHDRANECFEQGLLLVAQARDKPGFMALPQPNVEPDDYSGLATTQQP